LVLDGGLSLQLPRDGWESEDTWDFVMGQDATDYHNQWCVVFFDREDLQGCLARQVVTTGRAAPKVGRKGGRPTSMDAIEAELGEWINGEKSRLLRELDHWAPSSRKDDYSKTRIGRALAAWCANNGGDITWQTIANEEKLREKLATALNLL
jgi:hypothetical protein